MKPEIATGSSKKAVNKVSQRTKTTRHTYDTKAVRCAKAYAAEMKRNSKPNAHAREKYPF